MAQNLDPTHPKATDDGTEPDSMVMRGAPDDDAEGHMVRVSPTESDAASGVVRAVDDGEDDTEGHRIVNNADGAGPEGMVR